MVEVLLFNLRGKVGLVFDIMLLYNRMSIFSKFITEILSFSVL